MHNPWAWHYLTNPQCKIFATDSTGTNDMVQMIAR